MNNLPTGLVINISEQLYQLIYSLSAEQKRKIHTRRKTPPPQMQQMPLQQMPLQFKHC